MLPIACGAFVPSSGLADQKTNLQYVLGNCSQLGGHPGQGRHLSHLSDSGGLLEFRREWHSHSEAVGTASLDNCWRSSDMAIPGHPIKGYPVTSTVMSQPCSFGLMISRNDVFAGVRVRRDLRSDHELVPSYPRSFVLYSRTPGIVSCCPPPACVGD